MVRARPNTRAWYRRVKAVMASESPTATPARRASSAVAHITLDGTFQSAVRIPLEISYETRDVSKA
jgi:hypothetical protein